MNNFTQRSITGIFLIAIIIGAISFGYYSFLMLILVINLMSLLEFYKLFDSSTTQPRKVAGVSISIIIYISSLLVFINWVEWQFILINIPIVSSLFFLELFKQSKYPFQNIAITFLGIIYITFPLILFSFIAFLPINKLLYHPHIILGYFLMLWANDSGAYASGKNFGKHKLFKRISPKKTWGGSFGGACSALILAYLISCFYTEIKTIDWITIALIIIITGTFGDLIKSLMKRSLNVKDSGKILPGHGGMLDRFDSLLGSAPFVFSYIVLSGIPH